jgi:hypothetical protein
MPNIISIILFSVGLMSSLSLMASFSAKISDAVDRALLNDSRFCHPTAGTLSGTV